MDPSGYHTYTLRGTQLNGLNEGASYGDDAQMASNYPLVQLTAGGAVYKGLVFGVNKNGGFLFATNFRSGRIDVFGPGGGTNGLFTTATTDTISSPPAP